MSRLQHEIDVLQEQKEIALKRVGLPVVGSLVEAQTIRQSVAVALSS